MMSFINFVHYLWKVFIINYYGDDFVNKKAIKGWCIACAIFMCVMGSLFHFVYEWSGNNCFVGIFTPVSESVWEHLKLSFYPLLLFSVVDWHYLKDISRNYFLSKAVGVLTCNLFIVVVFYAYTFFTGKSMVWVDISLFFIGCIISQIVSYKLYTYRNLGVNFNILGFVLISLSIMLFTYFTFNPPISLGIFRSSSGCIFKYILRL